MDHYPHTLARAHSRHTSICHVGILEPFFTVAIFTSFVRVGFYIKSSTHTHTHHEYKAIKSKAHAYKYNYMVCCAHCRCLMSIKPRYIQIQQWGGLECECFGTRRVDFSVTLHWSVDRCRSAELVCTNRTRARASRVWQTKHPQRLPHTESHYVREIGVALLFGTPAARNTQPDNRRKTLSRMHTPTPPYNNHNNHNINTWALRSHNSATRSARMAHSHLRVLVDYGAGTVSLR